MSIRFPAAPSGAQELKELRTDPRVSAGAVALCQALRLGHPTLFATGSLPVFAAGDAHVLKLYPLAFAVSEDRKVSGRAIAPHAFEPAPS